MPITMPRVAFDVMLQHLVAMEEERESVLDMCFPRPGEERERMRALFDRYELRMNELIGRIKVQEDKGGGAFTGLGLPFVMIGSEVTVEDLDQGGKMIYRIQHPFKTDGGGCEISYVSPLGAALLLQEPGGEAAVDTPAGRFGYRIESIRLIM